MDKTIERKYYKTVVVSDVHLGHKEAKVAQAAEFLSSIDCKLLILNGDIFDGWQLQRSGKRWQPEYTKFLKILMRMIEKHETDIIYIVGNHDNFFDNIIPFSVSNVNIMRDYIHESGGHRYFVVHGDIFDYISYNMQWLAKLGELGYRLLLFINRIYNKYRYWRGKPASNAFSLKIKRKVVKAVSSSEVDQMMLDVTRAHKCDGIICGHTHRAEDRFIDNVRYLNSGDWMESLTALLEDEDGAWTIYRYNSQTT